MAAGSRQEGDLPLSKNDLIDLASVLALIIVFGVGIAFINRRDK
jgi:hypothetical protein